MARRYHNSNSNRKSRLAKRAQTRSTRFQYRAALTQRGRGGHRNQRYPFSPPETWYESDETDEEAYRIVVQQPGREYRHVVTPEEIRDRLSQLPREMVEPLAVVQLSRMTRKKQSFPCYGMQWGSTLYLYPMDSNLIEYFSTPPTPAQRTEAKMYGGRWVEAAPTEWKLIWTEQTIKDFYLNNILIHELGHLLDSRNSSYIDRERYAEWFAIEHGYRKTDVKTRPKKRVQKRHHGR